MSDSQKLAVIGAGGQAKVCLDILELMGVHPSLILGAEGSPGQLNGFDVESGYENISLLTHRGFTHVLIAVGDNIDRRNRAEECVSQGVRLFTAISPKSVISPKATVGEGSVVHHGAILDPYVEVGPLAIINTNSVISHDTRIGIAVHVAGQTIIGGGCKLGNQVFVGLGSTILPGLTIGDDIVIGAGSLVTKSLKDPGVYFGSPAERRI